MNHIEPGLPVECIECWRHPKSKEEMIQCAVVSQLTERQANLDYLPCFGAERKLGIILSHDGSKNNVKPRIRTNVGNDGEWPPKVHIGHS